MTQARSSSALADEMKRATRVADDEVRRATARREAIERQEVADRQERLKHIRHNLPHYLGHAGAPTRYRYLTRTCWESAFAPWTEQSIRSLRGERFTLAEISAAWVAQQEPLTDWLLLLFGQHGRRKTGFGTAVLGEALAVGEECLWLDAEAWVDALEWGLRSPSRPTARWQPATDVYQQAAQAPRLLLDDFAAVRAGRQGTRAAQDWWKERLTLLLREREAWARPTILTSNLDTLAETWQINHSLPSRLGVRWAFKVGGPDYRQKGVSGDAE